MLQKIEKLRYIRALYSLMGHDPSEFDINRHGNVVWRPACPEENVPNVARSVCDRIAEDQKTLLELGRMSEAAILESLFQTIQRRSREGKLLNLCA